jgi:hypothetical protein
MLFARQQTLGWLVAARRTDVAIDTIASDGSEELPMQIVTTIGLDIAKSVFQVHGVDAAGQVVIRRQLKHRYVLTMKERPGSEPSGQVSLK